MKRAKNAVSSLITIVVLGIASCVPIQAKEVKDKGGTSDVNLPVTPVSEVYGTDSYRVGVDDRLQISVWKNPELSMTVPVRPDGRISVPLLGDVQAGGLTPEEISASIKRRLVAFIREPEVTVIVTELRSHEFLSRVRVTGAVRTPRSLPYRPGMTVLDAVLESGGVNEFSAANRTKLHRKALPGGKAHAIKIELQDILTDGDVRTNVELLPGDVITVPERIF